MELGDGRGSWGSRSPIRQGRRRGAGRSCGAGRRARELGQPIPDPPGETPGSYGGSWGSCGSWAADPRSNRGGTLGNQPAGRHHATSHERHAPPCRNSSGVSFIALRDTYFLYTFSPVKRYCAARARARWFAATRDLVSLHVFFMNFIHAEAPHSPLRACANILNAK